MTLSKAREAFLKLRLIAAAFIAALACTPCVTIAKASAAQAQREAEDDTAKRLQNLERAEAGRAALAEKVAAEQAAGDLLAQQQMAKSARDLAGLTLLQVVIAAVGTSVLVVTIMQANKSMQISAMSVDQNGRLMALTQRHAEMQLKAYIDRAKWTVDDFKNNPNVTVELINRGQTPAKNVEISIGVDLLSPLELDPQWQELPESCRLQLVNSLVPNACLKPGRILGALTPAQKADFASQKLGIWVRGVVSFEDVFGGKYRQRFSGVFFGADAGRSRMSRFGNDEVELPTT